MREQGDEASIWGTGWRTITLAVMALLGVATLVGLIVTLGGANRERDRALRAQAHSYDVMILARTLSGTIARSEASLGRYVISTDRSLGQLYFDEWRLASTQLDRLDRLTDDNAVQQPWLDRLRAAFEARGEELSRIALSTNYGQNSQALARYYQSRQAKPLAQINATLNAIINRERDLLDRRTTQADASVERASHIAGALAVFGVLLVLGALVLVWFTMQALAERATARAEALAATERASELAKAVAAATSELRVQEAKLRQAQKMDAVGRLTGGIAHDFNNMLAVVLGGLELARRAVADPVAAARHIDSATDGATRAAALTRRLLTFSREESLKPETMVAARLVEGMSDLLDRTLGDGITLTRDDRSMGWRIHADRGQMENAILNLAVNARDAMDGRGALSIVTAAATLEAEAVAHCRAGDYVTIAVTDDGAGMTPEVAERVFEPFFTTKPADKGTGLGLSQIFALVRQMGGEIGIETTPGHGTTVTLYLPRETGMVTTVEEDDRIAPAIPAVATPLHVLVVEDDPRVLAATMGAMAELGHDAIACPDPLAAPGVMADHAIDLIVTDVLMPRQTGPEMIAGITRVHPHVAVLFVTGFAGETETQAFEGHEVLRKPFTLAALERAIGAALARDRPAPPHRIAAE